MEVWFSWNRYVDQTSLLLMVILMPHPLEFCNYRYVTSCLANTALVKKFKIMFV